MTIQYPDFTIRTQGKICSTCKLGTITISPEVGGFEDGIKCVCQEVAEWNNSLDEFNSQGFVHLWRIECVDDDAECTCWQSK